MLLLATCLLAADLPFGFATVAGPPAGPTPVVLTTTPRVAGAVHSVTWGGKEFIDSADHGRQLQSASAFDAGQPDKFWAECYNPTEAGSRADGAGAASTSRLVYLRASGRELYTVSRPAFWLRPGEASANRPARNVTRLADHLFAKHVTVGMPHSPHALDYRVTFTVPPGERHAVGQFEALTGYLPAEFSQFWQLLPTGTLAPLTDGPGEQPNPVALSTPDGRYAMGVWAPPHPGAEGPRYGRFRFGPEKVVKWNCVFRVRPAGGVPTGDHRFRMVVAVGSLENVRVTLAGAK